MHIHVCILLKPFCVTSSSSSVLQEPSVKRHLAYSKHSAASMNFAAMDLQKEGIFVQDILEFDNEFGVYRLQGSNHIREAATLVLNLMHAGIFALPMRSGFRHNK